MKASGPVPETDPTPDPDRPGAVGGDVDLTPYLRAKIGEDYAEQAFALALERARSAALVAALTERDATIADQGEVITALRARLLDRGDAKAPGG